MLVTYTILTIMTFSLIQTGEARIITVDDDSNNGDYQNIQRAIDNATGGDTIRVWEGTYYENLVVNKTVSLIGNESGVTIIDGGGKGIVVRITAEWCNVSGFNITGSGGTTWPAEVEDAGIKIESDYVSIFKNNCSFNNRSGIILYQSSYHMILNNTINSNHYYGIKLVASHYNLLADNVFNKNRRDGIHSRESNHNNFTNNTISANREGVCVVGPSEGNHFHYNSIAMNEKRGIEVGIEKDGSNDKYLINATYNYWGSNSGPYHRTKNPDGTGDNITDYVDFKPWLNENKTVNQSSNELQENNDEFTPIPPWAAAVGIVVVGSVGLLGLAYFREDLKIAFFSILSSPLYTKLEKDKILFQTNRHDIYRYLSNNPGVNYSRIKKELNLGTGTLVYHLNVLEKEGFIHSKKGDSRKIFFLKDFSGGFNRIEKLPISLLQKRIIDYLKNHGSASMRDIENALSLKQPSVSYNLRRLMDRGLVTRSGGKRNALYNTSINFSLENH